MGPPTYLIDTNWIIDFLAGRPDAVTLIAELAPAGIAISAVTHMEVMQGIRGSRNRAAAERAFAHLLIGAHVLDFTKKTAEHAADIRLDLRRSKRQLIERALDILVAATAIEHGLTLVTCNVGDRQDILGLGLFEWT